MHRRNDALQRLRNTSEIPVLIVGAGINGAGLFRELALQGVDVLMVDKADFCAGASSAPSRMIHGGLRYLENGEFRLVRESLKERNLLLQNAPHYVQPLPTTIPIFAWTAGTFGAAAKFLGLRSTPTNRGAFLIKVGLWMYDFFTRTGRLMPRHRFASKAEAHRVRPKLHPDIVCTATYYDAWISYPERLCLELIEDAEALHPNANALNYVSFVSGEGDIVTLRDELTGETFRVRPRVLVNATGAWIDTVNQSLRYDTTFIGGTKGSHLMIDNAELLAANAGEMIFFENVDNRVCIMFPLLGKVLAGSTDICVDHPEQAITTDADIDYILESVRQVFPDIHVKRDDIVFHFCGVRPLPRQSVDTPGLVSRDHNIRTIEPSDAVRFPVLSLIGGKWTTFRAFGEQAADLVLSRLKQTRRANSEHLPIGGGLDYPQTPDAVRAWTKRMREIHLLADERLRLLLNRYGTRAEGMLAYMNEGAVGALQHHPGYIVREIEYLVQHERVTHLDDLVLRRTTIALQGELTAPLLDELAAIVGRMLGWSPDEMQSEIERTRQILERKHGVYLQRKSELNHVESAS